MGIIFTAVGIFSTALAIKLRKNKKSAEYNGQNL
jgi:hypothetical protein